MDILLSPPDVDELEAEAAARAVASGWVAPLGPEVDAFEADFRSFTGAEDAAALNSGTAALHLAAKVAGVGPEDWVLAPTLTFVATLNAIAYTGAEIQLVDAATPTLNMDLDQAADVIERAAAKNNLPKAVVLVDLYGALSDTEQFAARCRELGVFVIEDAAEALGSTIDGKSAGTLADIGVFSFNGNKIMTTSGGGMCVGSTEHIGRIRWLASQAREKAVHYQHAEVGYNYRMSNILAAVGRVQLSKLPGFVDKRRAINHRYRQALGPLGIEIYEEQPGEVRNYWLSVGLLGEEHPSPHELCDSLRNVGVEARPGWKPMHLQPLYESLEVHGTKTSGAFFDRGICLPSGSGLSSEQQLRVIDAIRDNI